MTLSKFLFLLFVVVVFRQSLIVLNRWDPNNPFAADSQVLTLKVGPLWPVYQDYLRCSGFCMNYKAQIISGVRFNDREKNEEMLANLRGKLT